MKKILLSAICFILCFGLVACGRGGDPQGSMDKIEATVETWEAPAEYGRNENYKVEVSGDGETWSELAVYNVKNGHQKGDPLINQGGAVYFGEPYIASLVTFDFTGTVGVRVTYNKKALKEGGYVISPASYAVRSKQEGNTVTFTLTQNAESPRKVVFRPEGEWEAETLHIMTNVPEGEHEIDETADNVYIVENGAEVPRALPAGKDTYYFKKGIHTLPGGYWVDVDLGEVRSVASFDLATPEKGTGLPGGLCYEILARSNTTESWTSVKKSVGAEAENNINLKGEALAVEARYFRLVLHGNFNIAPVGNDRYIHTANVKEFTLYDGAGNNLSQGKAVAGSSDNYAVVTDGNVSGASYGNAYAGETFAVQSGCTYYLEKGAVVKGAFLADAKNNVTVRGRGILDSCDLVNTHELSEGRNGSIHFENCKDVLIEGITVMNAPMWMVVINHSTNVRVDGINLFGYCTNADGIHFSASKNAVATGCFIRTTDDLFVAYHYGDSDGLTFKNSVLWSDGARVLLLGLANEGNIQNVTLENCDVITYQNVWSLQESGGFAQIVATGGKTIRNVKIKDIRIDAVRFPVIAQFLQIRAGFEAFGTGFVKGVTVENVSYASECKPKSLISTVIPGGSVEDVTLKNVSIHGDTVSASNLNKYFTVDPDITVKFN